MKKHNCFGAVPILLLLVMVSCSGSPGHDDTMASDQTALKAEADAKALAAANEAVFAKVFSMFSTGNTEGIEDHFADDFVEHTPDPMVSTTGVQSLKDMIVMYHNAFPDLKQTILRSATNSDHVYVHYRLTGTNTGAMGEIPATGKSVDVNGVDIVRFENGKAAEHWGYFEEAKMMTQLGMAPDPNEVTAKK